MVPTSWYISQTGCEIVKDSLNSNAIDEEIDAEANVFKMGEKGLDNVTTGRSKRDENGGFASGDSERDVKPFKHMLKVQEFLEWMVQYPRAVDLRCLRNVPLDTAKPICRTVRNVVYIPKEL
ncbi:hypothetical protein L2E82_02234 [Cichorium intybus]|uniref:Uncharacterized protein n=1 Tax=Cichorium intybus TaxID=13427 RepID=A0ACB9H178_CICIN|nr:hypothetical protein L2E82_02234 [Cichorium intybus]